MEYSDPRGIAQGTLLVESPARRTDQPRLLAVPVNGIEIAVWEWNGMGAPILFLHATGFHGRCWDEVIRRLPGRHCLALELRGHGRSSKPAPPYRWPLFGSDTVRVAEKLGLEGAVGVGHSTGGHAIVAAAIERPQSFATLLLVDPSIFAPEWYGREPIDAGFIRKRRNVWESPEEMFARFHARTPFASWNPQVLRDYCEWGMLPDGDGYVLACPPDAEASVYEHAVAPEANLHAGIPRVAAPVTVLRAARPWNTEVLDLGSSPADPQLASRFPRGRDVLLQGRSHYIPMEAPETVAAALQF